MQVAGRAARRILGEPGRWVYPSTTMRKPIACISLVVAILSAGCNGGSGGGASGVDADLKKSGDELRKIAATMSVEELKKKMDEIEKYTSEMKKSSGTEPSQAEGEKAVKLMEVTGIYGAELMKRGG